MAYNDTTNSSQQPDILSIHLVPVTWDEIRIAQLILAIVGILGNSVVIHIFLRVKKVKHNTTNTFIGALALADLITSICYVPYPKLSSVPQDPRGSFYCKVVDSSNIMWISIVASVLTLTMLSVERYMAVAHPVKYKQIFTRKHTFGIIGLLWICSFAINAFLSYYVTLVKDNTCLIVFASTQYQYFIGITAFLMKYLLPVIFMVALNIATIRVLRKQARLIASAGSGNQHPPGHNASNRATQSLDRKITQILAIVVTTFIICWSPDQLCYLAFNIGILPMSYLFSPMYTVFGLMAFANSCMNPFIYAFKNKNFRKAFMEQQQVSSSSVGRDDNAPPVSANP